MTTNLLQEPSGHADQVLRGQLPLGLLPVVLHGQGGLRVRPVPCTRPDSLSEQVSENSQQPIPLFSFLTFCCHMKQLRYLRVVRFYFDFSTTYIGAGMICPHIVNISVLLGGILSWGVMWPLIAEKRGSWFSAELPDSSLEGMQGYRVCTCVPAEILLSSVHGKKKGGTSR